MHPVLGEVTERLRERSARSRAAYLSLINAAPAPRQGLSCGNLAHGMAACSAQDKQRLAVEPKDSVWLSASAGTGKTQVLSARVLRLLLQPGVEPGSILCLTFTKAGAAEMADRIHDRLAAWVQMDGPGLAADLIAGRPPSIDPAPYRPGRFLRGQP